MLNVNVRITTKNSSFNIQVPIRSYMLVDCVVLKFDKCVGLSNNVFLGHNFSFF